MCGWQNKKYKTNTKKFIKKWVNQYKTELRCGAKVFSKPNS